MTDIVVPALGESVTEATVASWMKKPGDAVAKDEPVVELETDKVNLEVPAPEAGVLAEIVAAEGATVEIGSVLATMNAGAAAPASAPAPAAAKRPAVIGARAAARSAETKLPIPTTRPMAAALSANVPRPDSSNVTQ